MMLFLQLYPRTKVVLTQEITAWIIAFCMKTLKSGYLAIKR